MTFDDDIGIIGHQKERKKERKKMTFSIGDKVKVNGIVGEIVLWHFDEGNVWHVDLDGEVFECYEEEMELVR